MAQHGAVVGCEDRAAALGQLLAELEALPAAELWRIRIFAGLRAVVQAERLRGRGLVEFLTGEGAGPVSTAMLSLLDARALAALGLAARHWLGTAEWGEHWFLLGVRDFGKHRRLVPSGRFERFDEAMLDPDVDWHHRYLRFSAAARCPSIEFLRLAACRVVQALDLETSGLEEVRRRLADELRLGHDFLSLQCVEQLLEDATSLRSLGGRGPTGGGLPELPESPEPSARRWGVLTPAPDADADSPEAPGQGPAGGSLPELPASPEPPAGRWGAQAPDAGGGAHPPEAPGGA